MALVDLGYAHFHHLAFETVDIGKMRDLLDHVARHGRWVSWGPTRHGIAGNIATYVRIPEEECHVELYCDMEQLTDDHVPRAYPRRSLLLEHLGAAAATVVLPLRPGRDRVRARELGDARQAASSRARRLGGAEREPAPRLHRAHGRPKGAPRSSRIRRGTTSAPFSSSTTGPIPSARSRFSPRGSTRIRIRAAARSSPPTGSRARRSATSSSIRRGRSTRRCSSSSTASSRARR